MADAEPKLSVFEWPAGKPLPPNARDCSDDMLPEGERISDAERAELRASPFRPNRPLTDGGSPRRRQK